MVHWTACGKSATVERILDAKTGIYHVSGPELGRVLDLEFKEYEIQAAVYALAFAEVVGVEQLREFVFFFTSVGESRVISIAPAWFDGWRIRVSMVVDMLRDRVRRGRDLPRPSWGRECKCRRCEYRLVCQPTGIPQPKPSHSDARGD